MNKLEQLVVNTENEIMKLGLLYVHHIKSGPDISFEALKILLDHHLIDKLLQYIVMLYAIHIKRMGIWRKKCCQVFHLIHFNTKSLNQVNG